MDNEFAFETRMGWVVLTWTGAGLRTLGLSGEAPADLFSGLVAMP